MLEKRVEKDGNGLSRILRAAARTARAWRAWFGAWAGLAASRAAAQLPDVATPDGIDEDSGDYIAVFQAYALQIVVLGGLIVAVAALFIVAKNILSKYSEIAGGRATWGELGMHAAAGVVLLVIVVFLMTQAAGVLD